jgi:hypothetical protein
MNFDVASRTILLVRHGSHAYGMNTPTSDLDSKGVCIEPKAFHFGFLHTFEQETREAKKGAAEDRVVYSLKKFAGLAAECNPNIIEVLHVADEHVLAIDAFGEELRAMRHAFVSAKARWTFAGYAHSQLKRIKTHRKWLVDPPKAPPTRKEFGLSEVSKISKAELGAFDAAVDQSLEIELSRELMTVFTREKQYQAAKRHYDQFENWKKTRNAARAELEAKFGLDTKHAAHLVRLLRMCKEIMTTGEVVVKRPDAAEFLSIRAGAWTYDQIVEYAERTEAECAALYDAGATVRHEPDRIAIDAAIVGMTERYLAAYG